MFHEAARKTYDAALCMYHDQALIPIKTLAFDHARQRHARPAVRAHLARSRHRVRHRRHRQGQSVEPGRRAEACGAACARRTSDKQRKPAAARVDERKRADDLPPLRDVIRRHDLSAKKSLGQNFLLDLNLTGRIARAAGPLDGVDRDRDRPGPGGLTRALLTEGAAPGDRGRARRARHRRARGDRGALSRAAHDRRRATRSNSIRRRYLDGGPARIVANLPYNIATALLVSWLTTEPWPPWYDRLVLMFQREVAERIVAPPGSKTYGRLSVLAGWRTQAKILFDVHPSNFVPPPKVTSSVVEFDPARRRRCPATAACSNGSPKRRSASAARCCARACESLGADPLPLLAAAGIEPTARAEEIPVEGFVALARALERAKMTA